MKFSKIKKIILVFVLFGFILVQAETNFIEDTIISLTGISDGSLLVKEGSVCEDLEVSGSELTVNNLSTSNAFILKTPSYEKALSVFPSAENVNLVIDSASVGEEIGSWTMTSDVIDTISFSVSVPEPEEWYMVKINGEHYNSFQSNSSNLMSFETSSIFSEAVFLIELDDYAPEGFNLSSPANETLSHNSTPLLSWEVPSDPDISYYSLFIDGVQRVSSISTNSYTVDSGFFDCGGNSWYIQAVDKAGNKTNSDPFVYNVNCGGVGIFTSSPGGTPSIDGVGGEGFISGTTTAREKLNNITSKESLGFLKTQIERIKNLFVKEEVVETEGGIENQLEQSENKKGESQEPTTTPSQEVDKKTNSSEKRNIFIRIFSEIIEYLFNLVK